MKQLAKGAILGRYEILDRIAVGGMAEIYLGRVRSFPTEKLVAIKRVLPRLAQDQDFVDMFIAEARLAATLSHPNIVDVFDVGVDHDSFFFAMEYIRGRDVREIRNTADDKAQLVPLAIALAIVQSTAAALEYAHTKEGPHGPLQLVHRDVSLSNILVSFDGHVKLVDFGIARAKRGTSSGITRTEPGQLKGKIPYMSPEQCRARPLDARADLFSLGVCLYELTTNQRPYDRETEFEMLEAIVHGRPAPPSMHLPNYPPALEAIVLKLLANRPAHRYQSAGELLVDLERFAVEQNLTTSQPAVAHYMQELFETRAQSEYEVEFVDESTRELVTPEVAELRVTFRPPAPKPRAPAVMMTPIVPLPVVHFAELEENTEYEIDPFAVEDATLFDPVELTRSGVDELLAHAKAAQDKGDLASAVVAVELALSADREDPSIAQSLDEASTVIDAIFARYIGDLSKMPAVSKQLEDLRDISIDQRAAFLLSRIDGTLSVDELLAIAGMPSRDASRHLCQLVLRGIVVLV